tara:strand:- start:165 stop:920 length:756 start_codon:yes stop_codon:yes gene_type:complete
MKKFLLTILTLVFTINVNSQVVQTWNWTANQGQSADFEKAVADKTKKYNSSKDGAVLYTFQINSGNQVGDYWRIRIENELKDFDKQYPSGLKAMQNNAGKHGRVTNSSWYNIVERATHWPEGDNNWKKPLKRYFVYNYDGEHDADFWAFRYKVKGALEQSGADVNMTTLQCFAGCQGNQVMVIFSHSNFEDLQNDNSSEWAKVYEKYNELYGVNYEADISEFESSLTLGGFGRYSGTMVFKPEMSSPQELK